MSQIRLTKRHKFNARPVTIDGHRFPSQAEARRYGELKLLERAGEIYGLELQPTFELLVHDMSVGGRLKVAAHKLTKSNVPEILPKRVGKYVADFAYRHAKTGERVVEDVKGVKTPLYKWKRKHVMAQYGIEIVEIGR